MRLSNVCACSIRLSRNSVASASGISLLLNGNCNVLVGECNWVVWMETQLKGFGDDWKTCQFHFCSCLANASSKKCNGIELTFLWKFWQRQVAASDSEVVEYNNDIVSCQYQFAFYSVQSVWKGFLVNRLENTKTNTIIMAAVSLISIVTVLMVLSRVDSMKLGDVLPGIYQRLFFA